MSESVTTSDWNWEVRDGEGIESLSLWTRLDFLALKGLITQKFFELNMIYCNLKKNNFCTTYITCILIKFLQYLLYEPSNVFVESPIVTLICLCKSMKWFFFFFHHRRWRMFRRPRQLRSFYSWLCEQDWILPL